MTNTHESDRASGEPASPPRPARRKLVWWLQRLVSGAAILVAGVLVIALLGLAQRQGWISAGDAFAASIGGDDSSGIFTCSMHPQIRQPGPGRCPICGMALVPATSSSAMDLDELAVRIEPAARRLANIQTAEVTSAPAETVVRTVGVLAIDESRQATIASYIDGRIERLFADYTGVRVQRGDHLAVIYSPQLYSAQVEYQETRNSLASLRTGVLEAVRAAQEKLVANSRQRLVELGVTDEQIAQLESSGQAQSRLTIYSPIGGTVIDKIAVEGMYVKAGDPIYRIAELSTVWLMLQLFPEQASQIRFGQQVEAEVQSLSGEVFTGRVAFIDPVVDPKTRTVDVRVELLNEQGRLRPGDFASARIRLPVDAAGDVYDSALAGKWISPMHPQIIRDAPGKVAICGMDLVPASEYGYASEPVPQRESLTIPRSAVLMAGENSVVYVESKPGRFEIRPVVVGPLLQHRIVIRSGLSEGENVATSGNFLIDSQMQLAGKPSLIDPTRAIAARQAPAGPLQLGHVHVTPIAGETGNELEQLIATYQKIYDRLVADQQPEPVDVDRLADLAHSISERAELEEEGRRILAEIATLKDKLRDEQLTVVRDAFKPLSHGMIRLTSHFRGADAEAPLTHVYCPMVPGGGGDWPQSGRIAVREIRNPYFGAAMLFCGETLEVLPVSGHPPMQEPVNSVQPTPSPAGYK